MSLTEMDSEAERPPEPADADGDREEDLTAHRLGQRIRDIRKRRDMTARKLAKSCDVTPGFISQVENGSVLPSIPTLLRLGEALGVKPSDLLVPDPPAAHLVRAHERGVYDYANRGFKEAIISGDESNVIEVAWALLAPGGGTGPELFTHGSTSECVVVLAGEIDIHIDEDTFRLGPGDCLTFSGRSRHGCVNRGEQPAEVYWITSPAVY